MEHFYSGGFVCSDTLTWTADASGLKLEGEIACKGNIVIDVRKLIAVEPWVGTDGWPTLGDFIEEVSDWYWKHRDELPEPDSVPALGLR